MEIQPQLLTLAKLLSGRLFRIPQYQRAYSWHSKQRSDLFADIKSLRGAGLDDTHFMATVVGLRREKREIRTTEHQVVEIVDGQQRLTTLVILLKSVAELLDPADDLQCELRKEIMSLLVKEDDVSLLLLQTNHDSSQHFAEYIRTGNHQSSAQAGTIADRELLSAMEDCERFVRGWLNDGGSVVELIGLLKNRLVFILYEISDERVVYTVFEVLNSRGLDVSWLDRAKSMLMGLAFESKSGNEREVIDELHQIWSNIYEAIGLRQGLSTEALRFAATLRHRHLQGRPLSEEDAVAELKLQANAKPTGVVDVSTYLLKVTRAVDAILGDKRREAVTDMSQARLLAVAILLRDDLPVGDREQLMGAWEKVSFRIFGLSRKDARTKVGEYVRLAQSVAKGNASAGEIRTKIRQLGVDYPAKTAAEKLAGENCYNGWQAELRYFLFRYEEFLAKERGQKFSNEQWNRIWAANASDSIEHIRAQSEGFEWVHHIGNLVLLPPKLNSKLSDRSPDSKKDDYIQTGLLIAADVARRIPTWGWKAAATRERELINMGGYRMG